MYIKIFLSRAAMISLLGSVLIAFAQPTLAADSIPTTGNSAVPPNPFGPKPAAETSATSAQSMATNSPFAPAPAGDFVTTLRAMLLRRFDKNGTGKLDAAELTEARKILSGSQDTHTVTPAEAAAVAYGPLFGLRPLIMGRFDHNGDGQLNAAELAEINTVLFGPVATSPNPTTDLATLQKNILRQFDKKGDGQLDATERAAAKAWLQQVIADLDKPTTENPAPQVK